VCGHVCVQQRKEMQINCDDYEQPARERQRGGRSWGPWKICVYLALGKAMEVEGRWSSVNTIAFTAPAHWPTWSRTFTSGFRRPGRHRSEPWPWRCNTAPWRAVEHEHLLFLGARAGLYLPFCKLESSFASFASFFLCLSSLMLEQSCELLNQFPPFDLHYFSSLWQEKKHCWHSFQGHWNI